MKTLPPVEIMYRALMEKDSSFEGIFYVAVKTTGIFCRPTCTARKPKRENIEYFATPQEALYAGYRPCLRCRPMENGQRPPALVVRLLRAVEQAPTERFRDEDLLGLNIDPSTARRQFKRYFGMTFHAYHRARRMGLALHEVRKGNDVIDAQIETGFESASGFRDAFAKVFGKAPSSAKNVNCLYARWLETPLGAMLALADDDGLHLLEFVDRRGLENELLRLTRRKCAIVPGDHRHLEQIAAELHGYFSGASLSFNVPLAPAGSEFQMQVWRQLQRIPPGETRSYGEMAAALGRPSAVRAVGRANGDNTLSIVIPCHRVIGADGSLTGYGGGLARKQWLLEHERKYLRGKKAA
jgi:AraC family transcriptional regulator of adaptative response/methylated-DNA-[protein]-cysteine methyltransferase